MTSAIQSFAPAKSVIKVISTTALLLMVCVALPEAHAGECKVKEPTQAVIADAMRIGVVLDLQMNILAKEYFEKTGQPLKVALVARAGSNLKDIRTLRNVDRQGRPLSLSRMIEFAQSQVTPQGDSMEIQKSDVKNAIEKNFIDKSKPQIYSHFGLIFWNHPHGKDSLTGENQQWWFRHMLRPCATDEELKSGRNANTPELYDEGTMRFFTDDPYELRAQILVPPPEIQDNLEKLTLPKSVKIDGKEFWDNRLPQVFKGQFYNAAAGWKNKVEANSNQFVLELLAAATQPFGRIRTRAEAQDLLEKTGYRPTRAMLSGTQALAHIPFASKIAPYVRLNVSEQPAYVEYSVAELITAMSVEDYMQRNNWILFNRQIHISEKTKILDPKK